MSQMPDEALSNALVEIVGQENVGDEEALLSSFRREDFESGEKPMLIVKPRDRSEVEELIRLARKLRINLVPCSSGTPHMKGGTLVQHKGIVVDLSGMDRIVLVDRRNKVAVIEPGVTFSQLKEETDKIGLKILTPLLPKAGKSVLASCLERDPILIPKYHWDMTDPLLCTEVVFGTGQLYRTGSAGGPGSVKEKIAAKSMFKNPLGPGQSDLVKIVQGSQGTMGIVTWASVKLEVRPTIHRLYFVAHNDLGKLIDFSYRVLKPKLADEFFILNSHAFASMVAQDPGDIKRGTEKEKNYILVYGVSGYDVCPEERVAYQEQDIMKIAKAVGLEISSEVTNTTGREFRTIIEEPSPEPYYKERVKGAFRDIMFLSTMDRVEHFMSVMFETATDHLCPESDLGVYIQPILFGRACQIEFSLFYNPEDKAESETVYSLYLKASKKLSEAGGFFSRPYGYWADLAYDRCPDTVRTLKKVKSIFDPQNILNQGKLVFKEVV
jgi:hypothetical protein